MREDADRHKCLSRKRGRPGNLVANWDQITALGPIELLDCTALNNLDWFRQGHGYLINLLCPEKGYHSDLTPAMELHIKEQVLRLRETPMGKFFERSAAAPQDLPDLQLYGIRMERAIEMSRALLRITRRHIWYGVWYLAILARCPIECAASSPILKSLSMVNSLPGSS